MGRRQKPPVERTLEYEGKTFTWYVEHGTVTVHARGAGSKTTQIGGSTAEEVAYMLAAELRGDDDDK